MSQSRYENIGSPCDKVVEECAELIKAISKARRFGWKDYHPNRPHTTNAKEVLDEISDVQKAVLRLETIILIGKDPEEHNED